MDFLDRGKKKIDNTSLVSKSATFTAEENDRCGSIEENEIMLGRSSKKTLLGGGGDNEERLGEK